MEGSVERKVNGYILVSGRELQDMNQNGNGDHAWVKSGFALGTVTPK